VANTVGRRACPSPFPDQEQAKATRMLSGRVRSRAQISSGRKANQKDSGEGSHKATTIIIDRNLVRTWKETKFAYLRSMPWR
jgi:hypothetical protein